MGAAYGAVWWGALGAHRVSHREHISLNSLADIRPPDGISASLPTLDLDPMPVVDPLKNHDSHVEWNQYLNFFF